MCRACRCTPFPSDTSHKGTAELPDKSSRLSVPPATKAIDRLSGDQNSDLGSSVPGTARAVSFDSDRSQILDAPEGDVALNASCEPSGESANAVVSPLAVSPGDDGLDSNAVPWGRCTSRRTDTPADRLESAGRIRLTATIDAATSTRHATARAVAVVQDSESDGRPAAAVFEVAVSAIHFSSPTKSRAVCQRSSGSFTRHFLTMRSRAGGDQRLRTRRSAADRARGSPQ